MKEGKFGIHEAICLSTTVLIAKVFYTSIRVIIKSTGTAAWYTTLVSCATSMLLFLLVCVLMQRFPGKNLIEIFETVTGKIIGKILGLIFCGYLIFYAGSNLREFLEMIKAYNLPYTAPSLILAAFFSAVIVMTYIGLEGIARVSCVCFYPIILGIAFILILAYPSYHIDYIFPIGGYGIAKTLYYGSLRSSAYDEVVFLAIVINSLHGVRNYKKAGLVSLLILGISVAAVVFCSLMAFEYTTSSENISALFQLARQIYFNRFFQRVESIFLLIWSISSIITVTAGFYLGISTYCKVFKIGNYRPLIFPFSFFTFMVVLIPKSLSELGDYNIAFIRQYGILIVYLIPILVLLISVILGKKGGAVKVEKD